MDSLGLSLPLLLLFWTIPPARATSVSSWTYTGSVGQSKWSDHFPDCGSSAQSPVDLVTSQARYDPSLGAVTPLGYSQHGNEPFSLSNNGHSVVLPLPEWMGLGGLPWFYTAVQMHLHWGTGAPGGAGSEHTINAQGAPAELHLVHYNSELYPNMSVAMTQRSGLAVLGILIEVGEETNQPFGNIINYLARVRHAGQSTSIPAFDVQSLLPPDLGRYYRYNGSLTTPPCHESVLWTVLAERVKISQAQLLKLGTMLYATKAENADRSILQNNYRTTQPLNRRVVLASFPTEAGKVYNSGEISAIIMGALCGCVGLAVIIRFIVKTIRTKESKKEQKQDVVLNTSTSDPGRREDPAPASQTQG